MKKNKTFLDLLIFEIRYSYGNLYWDRCGQTVLDIETQCDGWFSARDDKNVGRLENPEKRMTLIFTESSINLATKKPENLDNDIIAEEALKSWKIIRANLGLEEYDSVGCRFHFLKPTNSVDESEVLIEKSELNVRIPDHVKELDYDLNIRQVIAIFEKEDMEYRVELKGITRSEGIDPAGLLSIRPKAMPKRQKEYRLQKMKQLAEYSVDPMYAVMLDIDCVKYNPEQISVGEYINKQIDVVRKDFLPILEKL